MKDEIKEILDRLERIDHKEYIAFEFADGATFDETARCFEERKKLADCIINLQEENKKLLQKSYSDDVKITKAIGWVKKNMYYFPRPDELLNILNGEDKK